MMTGETQRSERGNSRLEALIPFEMGQRRGLGETASSSHEESVGVSKISKVNEGATSAVSDGWMSGGSLFSSILAGTLLGLALDTWLSTSPWFVVAGVVAGSISGFYRMWQHMGAVQGKQDIFHGR